MLYRDIQENVVFFVFLHNRQSRRGPAAVNTQRQPDFPRTPSPGESGLKCVALISTAALIYVINYIRGT